MAGRTKGSRSAAGTGTIRKKTITKNGKTYTYWEARYTVGFDPGTGKQQQRSISGKTQKEVAQKLRQITAEIDRGTYQEPEKMTLREWLDIWVTEYLGNTKPHTRKSYISIINNHINPALGAVSLSALTPIQVQRMINGIRSTKPTMLHQKVNPKTIKNVHGVLHSALSQAVQCGLLRSNPADHAVLPRRFRAEIHVLEAERITEFLRAIEGHRYQYLYLLDLLTGMRQSELLGLQWEDIDWEKGCITVKRQLQFLGGKEGYRYTTPKSNKPRIIVLPDVAIRALEKQRALQKQLADFFQEGWSNPDHLVFTDELGGHIKHDVVYRNLKRIFAGMGLPDLRFHDLRHSYAVLSLQSGCDIKTVQENLGHYAAAFTLDTYGHVTDQMRREGAEKMNRFLHQLEERAEGEK